MMQSVVAQLYSRPVAVSLPYLRIIFKTVVSGNHVKRGGEPFSKKTGDGKPHVAECAVVKRYAYGGALVILPFADRSVADCRIKGSDQCTVNSNDNNLIAKKLFIVSSLLINILCLVIVVKQGPSEVMI